MLPEPVAGRPRETAVSVVVPEAEAPTLDYRRRFLERTLARKIPTHVTLLYPFVDAERALAGVLPLRCSARSVTLHEEQTDGTRSARAAFPLGGR